MSVLTTYFVCERPLVLQWLEALAEEEGDRREAIEAAMPAVWEAEGITHVEVNLLAQCAAGGLIDHAAAATGVELVEALDPEEGPWITAFQATTLRALATLRLDDELIADWIRSACAYTGEDEEFRAATLTREAAGRLQHLAALALPPDLGLYTCFYG